jgi:NAD(P)-dependent dehydrogenase (short-subunit alcohol dehydrogenase family)
MDRKTVLITGANKGIGFEIARQLCQRDFHVIISGRDRQKMNEALERIRSYSASAEMLLMDVASESSIKQAAAELAGQKVIIDVLINNAGIQLDEDRNLLQQDLNVMIKLVNTNSYGPLRIIIDFLPLMKRPGRIINVSSDGGSMTYPIGGWSPAYCVSKTMLNSITRHVAYELADEKISVNAVSPGWVRTDMGGSSAPWSVEKGAETPVWLAAEAPENLTGKFIWDKKVIQW